MDRRRGGTWTIMIVAFWTAVGFGCAPRSDVTGLRVVCAVLDASVFVDGKYVGRLQVLQDRIVALPSGTHRVAVRRHGYFPRYRMVTVRPHEVVTLKLVLRRMLPGWPRGARPR